MIKSKDQCIKELNDKIRQLKIMDLEWKEKIKNEKIDEDFSKNSPEQNLKIKNKKL